MMVILMIMMTKNIHIPISVSYQYLLQTQNFSVIHQLVKKGPKNSGMGKPLPLFGQCPKENVHCLVISSLRGPRGPKKGASHPPTQGILAWAQEAASAVDWQRIITHCTACVGSLRRNCETQFSSIQRLSSPIFPCSLFVVCF